MQDPTSFQSSVASLSPVRVTGDSQWTILEEMHDAANQRQSRPPFSHRPLTALRFAMVLRSPRHGQSEGGSEVFITGQLYLFNVVILTFGFV